MPAKGKKAISGQPSRKIGSSSDTASASSSGKDDSGSETGSGSSSDSDSDSSSDEDDNKELEGNNLRGKKRSGSPVGAARAIQRGAGPEQVLTHSVSDVKQAELDIENPPAKRAKRIEQEQNHNRSLSSNDEREQALNPTVTVPVPVAAGHALSSAPAREEGEQNLELQRSSWEALRKGVNDSVHSLTAANIKETIPSLFMFNLLRGHGLLVRAVLKAQLNGSPRSTAVYAALIASLNTKLPQIGDLCLRRCLGAFQRATTRVRVDRATAAASVRLIAHLVNHNVAHEILPLQILTVLLERPTDDSVELAGTLVLEAGRRLAEVSPHGVRAVFERLRVILQEGLVGSRTQAQIERLFAARKGSFSEWPSVPPALDIVEQSEQITHELMLGEGPGQGGLPDEEEALDVFQPLDALAYQQGEDLWAQVQAELFGVGGGGGGGGRRRRGRGGRGGSGGGQRRLKRNPRARAQRFIRSRHRGLDRDGAGEPAADHLPDHNERGVLRRVREQALQDQDPPRLRRGAVPHAH
jgi:pre-mRNA-splicing factor CWC22